MLDSIDINKLATYEKASGYTGLTDAIVDINKAQQAVKTAWNQVDADYLAPEDWQSTQTLKATNNVQSAVDSLNRALSNYYDIMQTRVDIQPNAGWNGVLSNLDAKISKLQDEEALYNQMAKDANLESVQNEAQQIASDTTNEIQYWQQQKIQLENAMNNGEYPPEYKGTSISMVDATADNMVKDLNNRIKGQFDTVYDLQKQLREATSNSAKANIQAQLDRALEAYNNTKGAIEVLEIAQKKGLPINEQVANESQSWLNRPLTETSSKAPVEDNNTNEPSTPTGDDFKTQLQKAMKTYRMPEPATVDIPLRDKIGSTNWLQEEANSQPLKEVPTGEYGDKVSNEEPQPQMQREVEVKPQQRQLWLEQEAPAEVQTEVPIKKVYGMETNEVYGETPEVVTDKIGVPSIETNTSVPTTGLAAPMPNKSEPVAIPQPAIGTPITTNIPTTVQEWSQISKNTPEVQITQLQSINTNLQQQAQTIMNTGSLVDRTAMTDVIASIKNNQQQINDTIQSIKNAQDIQSVIGVSAASKVDINTSLAQIVANLQYVQSQIALSTNTTTATNTNTVTDTSVKTATAVETTIGTSTNITTDKTTPPIGLGIPLPNGDNAEVYNPQRTKQGTIVVRVGAPKGYPDGQWKVMPPPYNKVYTEKQAPIGTYKFPAGKGSTLASLQIIGGAPRKPIDVEMDLGVTSLRVYTVKNKVYGEWIRNESEAYKGKEEKVEERIPTRSQNISKRLRDEWEKADHLPDYFEPSPEMSKVLLPQYSKGKMKVYAVDMAYLRTKYADVSIGDRIGQDLTLGGHNLVYWKLIKPNEIYISNKLDGVDRDGVVGHEYKELNTMRKGKEYSPAHNDDANPLEIKIRRNPSLAKSLINKEATIAAKQH